MNPALVALMIFSLRIADVSVGTIRVIYTVRGKRLQSVVLGIIESAVWIFAISRCMVGLLGGIGDRRQDVVVLKEAVIAQDLFERRACTQQFQYISHTNALAADAWLAAAFPRLDRDP